MTHKVYCMTLYSAGKLIGVYYGCTSMEVTDRIIQIQTYPHSVKLRKAMEIAEDFEVSIIQGNFLYLEHARELEQRLISHSKRVFRDLCLNTNKK